MRGTAIAILFFIFLNPTYAAGVAGQLDPSFGGVDLPPGAAIRGFNAGGENTDFATALIRDAHGRLYLIGVVERSSGSCLGLIRFSKDGADETSGFGTNGKICHADLFGPQAFFPLAELDATFDTSGRLLVAGLVIAQGAPQPFVCRFLANGAIDPSLNAGPVPGCVVLLDFVLSYPNAIRIVQRAETIYMATTLKVKGLDQPTLIKLAADGQLIPFGQSSALSLLPADFAKEGQTADVLLIGDGLIAVGSVHDETESSSDFFVSRVDVGAGKLDNAFNANGAARFDFGEVDVASAIALASSGDVIVAGSVQTPSNVTIGLVRISAKSGHLGTNFNAGKPLILQPCDDPNECNFVPTALEVSQSGAIAIAALDGTEQFAGTLALRLLGDEAGTLDARFGNTPAATGLSMIQIGEWSPLPGMVLQGEKIILGGAVGTGVDGGGSGVDYAMVRLRDGSLFNDGFESTP